MVSVTVYSSGSNSGVGFDQSLKSLQRKIQREANMRELKNHRQYNKPSVRKRKKLEESARRRRKINRKVRMDVSYRSFVLFSDGVAGGVSAQSGPTTDHGEALKSSVSDTNNFMKPRTV